METVSVYKSINKIPNFNRYLQLIPVQSTLKLQNQSFLWVDPMQINEFQDMMKKLYFHRDSERGWRGTYNWLVDEVKELGEALEQTDMEATEKEFADVIAWLASLANVVGVELENAALAKYPHKCPKCQQAPCQCDF